jgi:hypothetical protein
MFTLITDPARRSFVKAIVATSNLFPARGRGLEKNIIDFGDSVGE